MGQYSPFNDQVPLEEQIKTLGDDELLDFWEETQYLAKLSDQEDMLDDLGANPEYERMIIQELQVRTGRKGR